MGNFLTAVAYVIANEGGALFTNARGDRGGPTRYGVTLATLSAYRGAPCAAADVASLGLPEAQAIYQSRYWTPLRLDGVSDPAVATAVLDTSALCGVTCAARTLQAAVGAEVDGVVGPKTLAATAAAPPGGVITKMQALLTTYLTSIAARDPTQRQWLAGWLCRVGKLGALPLAHAADIT